MSEYNNTFHEKIKDMRFDGTLEKQRELVIEALPEFESFLLLGHRPRGHKNGEWLASSSMRTPEELFESVLNLMLGSPMYGIPILKAASSYQEILELNNNIYENNNHNQN